MVPESKTVLMHLADSAASGADVVGVVDTIGFNYLTVDVLTGTASAAETAVTALQLGETDDSTAHSDVTTDMDLIPAFTGAAATSTSAGFVLPARSSATTNIYRFNVDLRGRKRYIGCHFNPVTTVAEGVAIVGHLYRKDVTPYAETVGTATEGYRVIVSG
ncbi:MAG: hypothetical protein QM570_15485 [Planctomycetota bacterium]|jgi:hypothetical protein|nr:hypothetical protein [Planctomycetota bacterium]